MTIVGSQNTLVNCNRADITISNISEVALAFVTGRDIQTICIWCTFMHAKGTFINLFIALFTIAIKTGVAHTFKSGCFVSVLCLLGFAGGGCSTVVDATEAIVGFDACCQTQFG